MSKPEISAQRLRELLSYDPETGVFRWLVSTSNRVKVGDVAGSVGSNGYRTISVDGRRIHASILAWLFMRGEMPAGLIDHESRERSDDRWQNLRLATFSQNAANAAMHRDNASGFKGVQFHAAAKKWRARICVKGRTRSLGLFPTPERAHAAYCRAAAEVFGQFASGGGHQQEI